MGGGGRLGGFWSLSGDTLERYRENAGSISRLRWGGADTLRTCAVGLNGVVYRT